MKDYHQKKSSRRNYLVNISWMPIFHFMSKDIGINGGKKVDSSRLTLRMF